MVEVCVFVTSQQKGSGFDAWVGCSGFFVCRFCAFSACLHGLRAMDYLHSQVNWRQPIG